MKRYFSNEHADKCPQDLPVGRLLQRAATLPQSHLGSSQLSRGQSEQQQRLCGDQLFPCSGIALGMGENVEVQQQFHIEPYQNLDESNDYSFRLFPATYVDWDRVTVHHDGELVWGAPPSFD